MSNTSNANLLELTVGNGTASIQLPGNMTKFDYRVVSGPGIPLPASASPDMEFIDFSLQQKTVQPAAARFPRGILRPRSRATAPTVEWYAVITWFVQESRVIEYAFS